MAESKKNALVTMRNHFPDEDLRGKTGFIAAIEGRQIIVNFDGTEVLFEDTDLHYLEHSGDFLDNEEDFSKIENEICGGNIKQILDFTHKKEHAFPMHSLVEFSHKDNHGKGMVCGISDIGDEVTYIIHVLRSNIDKSIYPYSHIALPESELGVVAYI